MAGSPLEMKIIGTSDLYWINTTTNPWFGWYMNNNMMVLSVAAMFILGILIWVQRSRNLSSSISLISFFNSANHGIHQRIYQVGFY